MALNYLLHRHQVSLIRASDAKSVEARHSHQQLALGYAREIEKLVGPTRGSLMPLVPIA